MTYVKIGFLGFLKCTVYCAKILVALFIYSFVHFFSFLYSCHKGSKWLIVDGCWFYCRHWLIVDCVRSTKGIRLPFFLCFSLCSSLSSFFIWFPLFWEKRKAEKQSNLWRFSCWRFSPLCRFWRPNAKPVRG